MPSDPPSILDLALKFGMITPQQLKQVMDQQAKTGEPLVDILLDLGLISAGQLRELMAGLAPVERTIKLEPARKSDWVADPMVPTEVNVAAVNADNRLGKFILIRMLGRGGMGEVYKAWEVPLSRFVALKLVRGAPDILREARTAAQLEHEHIAPVYEVGTGNPAFISMKYIEGDTLDRAQLSIRQKVKAIRDAAKAIAYAHSKGIIHRDIKPQNIMVESSAAQKVYVMDFGLAKQTRVDTTLSASGVIAGTPPFMPPEQARGKPQEIDERSDVYSLGAALYEVLTGVPPFTGDDPLEVLQKVIHTDPPSPRGIQSSIPRELEIIALKCLEKDKNRRYPSAQELADDLKRYLDGEPIQARPAGTIYRARKFAGRHKAGVAMALLALAAGAYGLHQFLWPGTADVQSDPPGAEIFIDGRSAGRETPASVWLWPPGEHVIDFKKKGYDDGRIVLSAAAGQSARGSVRLTRNIGFLTVTSNPAGAQVVLESHGRATTLGKTPIVDVPIERRVYLVRLTLPGFEEAKEAVEVAADAHARVDKTLAPEMGTLDVGANIDGIVMTVEREGWEGRTLALPAAGVSLPIGIYRLAYSAVNHHPRRATVEVRRNSRSIEQATLNPMQAWTQALAGAMSDAAATADLDRDGALDCILPCEDGKIYVLSGRQGGLIWEFATGDSPATPLLADLDGDGILDVIVGPRAPRSNAPKIFALSGRDGSKLWEFGSGPWVRLVRAAADFDGDGILDFVVQTHPSQIVAISGKDGSPIWSYEFEGTLTVAPALPDLDGDGVPDLLVEHRPPDPSARPDIFALSGKDRVKLWEVTSTGTLALCPTLADFDSDGIPDCIVTSSDKKVFALSGRNGAKIWDVASSEPPWSTPCIADLNRDGTPDCVLRFADGSLIAVSGKNGSKLWERSTERELWFDLGSADLDGDGIPDIVGASRNKPALYAYSGKDGAPLWDQRFAGDIGGSPVLADVDGDGFSDCIVRVSDSKIYAVSGKSGARIFVFKTSAVAESGPVVADFRGDGSAQCFVGCRDGRVVAISGRDSPIAWELRQDRFWRCPPLIVDGNCIIAESGPQARLRAANGRNGGRLWENSTAEGVLARETEDFNGDKAPDYVFATRGETPRAVTALSGKDGSTIWKFESSQPVYLEPVLADVNDDGVRDAIVCTSSIFALSGKDGTKLWEQAVSPSDAPLIADLNGDKIADFVVRIGDRQICALSGKDGAVLWTFQAPGRHVFLPALADVNGDGIPDCIVGADDRTIRALSGRDGSVLWECKLEEANLYLSATRPLIADLDGDGKPDVIAACNGSRVDAISGRDGRRLWQIDAGSVISSAPVLGDLDADGVPDVIVACAPSRIIAVSGKRGTPLWRYESDGTRPPLPVLSDVDGDKTPDCVFVSASGDVIALSGKDGGVLLRVPCSAESVAPVIYRSGEGPALALVECADQYMRAVSLERRIASGETIRESICRYPDGSRVPAVCGKLLRTQTDRATRAYLLINCARYLLSTGQTDVAAMALGELRALGGTSYALYACLFLCDGSPANLGSALLKNPEQAYELLVEYRSLWREASVEIEGTAERHCRARAVALLMKNDFDLAAAELRSAQKAGGDAARISRFFPSVAEPYLARARKLAGNHARVADLAWMAARGATGSTYSEAILLSADACLKLGDKKRASEMLKEALARPDVSPEDRRKIQELMNQ